MPAKQTRKQRWREAVNMHLKGPMTDVFLLSGNCVSEETRGGGKGSSPSWKEEFNAIVTRDVGQTQWTGYTRKRRQMPATPYPMKLDPRAIRTWYEKLPAYFWLKYLGRYWVQTAIDQFPGRKEL